MKKFKRILAISAVAILFLGTFLYLWVRSRPEKEKFEEVVPAVSDIYRSTIMTGKIIPRNEINIKPQISGIISEILKEAGDKVSEGDVIAKVKVIPEMSSLSAAQSRVRLAELNLEQAQTDFDREKALYEKKLVSEEEFDQFRQMLAQAKEEMNAATESLEVVRDGVSKSNAKSSSTLIRSTITGIILDIPVKVGNSVIQRNTFNDGTTIATVADMNDLIFDGMVDETEVGKLYNGMSVNITIGALESMNFDAVLEFISPKATEVNGANQFEIKAAVTIPEDKQIRSGYSANAELILEKAENVLTIPEGSVEFAGDSCFVYVGDNKSGFTKTPIETGLGDGIKIEVKSGITTENKIRGNKIIEKK